MFRTTPLQAQTKTSPKKPETRGQVDYSLWSLPFAALGGEMIIWGVQLIRGCNTKNKKGNEK